MSDLMLSAVVEAELQLKAIREQADAAELDLEVITSVRKKLVSITEDLAKEHARRSAAINRYNLEVEKIIKHGRRAVDLAKTPLPLQIANMPAIKKALKGKEEIHAAVNEAAVKIEKACGVYFLLKENEIVYIGQSINCFSRVSSHTNDATKDFNRVCYVPVNSDELNAIEEILIAIFKPKHNRAGVTVHFDESDFFIKATP